jgi:hypothetical protein
MPNAYSGNTAGLSGRPTVTILEPISTDTRDANSVQVPFRKLADFVQHLMANAAFLGANVFTATQQISSGALELTQAAAQAILKAGSGKLQVGTKAGNNSDLELLINGVVKAILRASDGKMQGQSTALGDVGTTLASKDYVEPRALAKGRIYLNGAAFTDFVDRATVTRLADNTGFRIAFDDFSNGNVYALVATHAGASQVQWRIDPFSQTEASVEIKAYNPATGAAVDTTTLSAQYVHLIALR